MICKGVWDVPQSKIIVKSIVGSRVIKYCIVWPLFIVVWDASISNERIAGWTLI